MNEAMQTGQKPEKLVKELRKDQDRINKMSRIYYSARRWIY